MERTDIYFMIMNPEIEGKASFKLLCHFLKFRKGVDFKSVKHSTYMYQPCINLIFNKGY